MPSIHGFEVTVFQGEMPRSRRGFALVEQPGVDGTGAVFDAWRSGPTQVTTRVLVAAGSALGLLDQYRATQGRHGTVVDQFGVSWPLVLVLDVVPRQSLTVTGEALVTAEWTLLPQSVRPT